MDNSENFFKHKLKKAYEIGRFKRSLWPIIPALVFVCLGVEVCHSDNLAVCLSILIGVLAIFFLWKGGGFSKAVIPALILSGFAIAGPYLIHIVGLCCARGIEFYICTGTGVILGFIHGYAPARNKNLGYGYLFGGAVIIAIGGIIGCSYMGKAGILGVLGGVAAGMLSSMIFVKSVAKS